VGFSPFQSRRTGGLEAAATGWNPRANLPWNWPQDDSHREIAGSWGEQASYPRRFLSSQQHVNRR
jgi:hypothetical protein